MVIMDKELLQFLLERDYAVVVKDRPFLTKKFTDLFEISQEVVSEKKGVSTQIDSKALWNKFIADAEIPHRVKAIGGTGEYTVRQYNTSAATKLRSIVNTASINYSTFVESTKNYYKNNNLYRTTLSNYLVRDIWKDEYELFEKKGKTVVQDGSSRWES